MPLNVERFLGEIPVAKSEGFPPAIGHHQAEAERLSAAIQKAKDAAMPDRSRQGGVLAVGQEVELCGCRFKVHAMHGKKVILKGIPAA